MPQVPPQGPQMQPPMTPAPASMPPQPQQGPVPQPQLSQEQMKTNLHNLFAAVTNKFSQLHAQNFAMDKKLDARKSKILKVALQELKSMGIDPGNVHQVHDFLEKIKQTNPTLYQNLENGLGGLIK